VLVIGMNKHGQIGTKRHSILMVVCLEEDILFSGEENSMICRVPRLILTWVRILPHKLWGRASVLMSIYCSLMWYWVLKNPWLLRLHIIFWNLWRALWTKGSLCVHGLFHSLVIKDLGTMVSIIPIFTTQCERKTGLKVIVLPLVFLVVRVSPILVLITIILSALCLRIFLLGVSPLSLVGLILILPFIFGIV